ncbi:UNVERIFIED_CONTAM: hypothetical protein Sangu_2960000 [Sesamum angustifolium]|uniref:Reverse transcriptase n=1 Tax=Sesamum angustifolium TaxID=2727405 RepID=A0AAW2IKL6_9LAMI
MLEPLNKATVRRLKILRNNARVEVYGPNENQATIAEYFSNIFKSTNPDSWVIEEILSCLEPRVMEEMNEEFLMSMLLPKCANPELVYDFHPIFLCNVVYKLASKAIANRLKPLLNTSISNSQSAFVLGRLIFDNVLVAYEVNHYLAHKYQGNSGYVSLKLDLSKA